MANPLLLAAGAGSATTSRALLAAALTVVTAPLAAVVAAVVLAAAAADGISGADGIGAPDNLHPGTVPAAYEALVLRAGQTCPGITAPLLAAQLDAESGWNPSAVSAAGAQGLAQFMPGTWTGEGVDGDGDGLRDPFTPADAIASQARFMCRLLAAVTADQRLTGDRLDLALASYNAGLGAVQRYRAVPPYPETQAYVRRIRSLLPSYAEPAAPDTTAGPSGRWVRPITGPITSGFGPRWGRLHAGVDFGAPIGTPVYAASDGTVVAAGAATGYGKWVKLAHADGLTTVYGHISAWRVSVGHAVQAGQLIADSGNEGRSTGPHLHFEVRQHDVPVDPARFFTGQGTSLS